MKGLFYIGIYATIVALLFMLMSSIAFAEGNIAVNFSQVINESSAGLLGEYETQLHDRIGLEIDGDLQSGGIYRGKIHAELLFDISTVDLKLITNTTVKGYALDSLGRDSNGYIAGTVSKEDVNLDIGIGGKQASPWGAPNAVSDLVPMGYDEEALLAIGADKLSPAPRGVVFQNGAFLQGYVATGWERGDTEFGLKGILQLTGADKAHQLIGSIDYVRDVLGSFTIHAGGELLLVKYASGLQSEAALFFGGGYKW